MCVCEREREREREREKGEKVREIDRQTEIERGGINSNFEPFLQRISSGTSIKGLT